MGAKGEGVVKRKKNKCQGARREGQGRGQKRRSDKQTATKTTRT